MSFASFILFLTVAERSDVEDGLSIVIEIPSQVSGPAESMLGSSRPLRRSELAPDLPKETSHGRV